MISLSPRLAVDAFEATEEQLTLLDDRFMDLLVHTDLLTAQGHDVTNDVRCALMRIVSHLRAVRHELRCLRVVYRVIRDGPERTQPS